MGEQDILAEEPMRIADGCAPRDLGSYSAWRDSTDYRVIEALYLYGTYLSGALERLSLTEVSAMCDIEGIAQDARAELAHLVIMIHGRWCAVEVARRRKPGHG